MKIQDVLVVGGAGYIGSHMARILIDNHYKVTVLDNLSTGHLDAISGIDFIHGDLANTSFLDSVISSNKFNVVMHFASSILVGESVLDPGKYYQNNLVNTINLLEAMRLHGVNNFVFSSSAATFGRPSYLPIDELHPQMPINPYGWTKYMVEQVLKDYSSAYGMAAVVLRYFNASGNIPDASNGERHEPETHLIPLVLQVANRRMPSIKIFGNDYNTPDGTCIRDYVHVLDLCSAHLLAMKYLQGNGGYHAFNLGNGVGFSNQQVLNEVQKITNRSIKVEYVERRAGDPDRLVADSRQICETLGWEPKYSDLSAIIKHAWAWETKRFPARDVDQQSS